MSLVTALLLGTGAVGLTLAAMVWSGVRDRMNGDYE
jgi:hypothetical protein